MRRYIYAFRRDGKLMAEIDLDVCPNFSTVEKWQWRGDPEVPQIISPLPNKKWASLLLWFAEMQEAAERQGLEMIGRYEGEKQPTPGQDYFPSQETIDNCNAYQEAWDRAVASGWSPLDYDIDEGVEYISRLMKVKGDDAKSA